MEKQNPNLKGLSLVCAKFIDHFELNILSYFCATTWQFPPLTYFLYCVSIEIYTFSIGFFVSFKKKIVLYNNTTIFLTGISPNLNFISL